LSLTYFLFYILRKLLPWNISRLTTLPVPYSLLVLSPKNHPRRNPPEYLTTNIAQDQMLLELAVPASSFITSHNNPYCQKHTKLSMQQYEVLTQQE
jgi:hypothetical protein